MMSPVSKRKSARNETRPVLKRKALRYDEKVKIINKLNASLTPLQISRQTGIPYNTIFHIQKQKNIILATGKSMSKDMSKRKCRERNPFLTKVEHLTFLWIEDMRTKRFPLSGDTIKLKARSLYEDICMRDDGAQANIAPRFSASSGWVAGFKRRFNLSHVSLVGESASADEEAARQYLAEFETLVDEGGYDARQIFNADETGLYWKKMPKNTFITENEMNAPGFKVDKQRITLLLGGNAKGDFKLKPMLINRAQNPRALKKIRKESLPVAWYNNRKAWMTQEIFRDWFVNYFAPSVSRYNKEQNLDNKALLLLDNAASHPRDLTEKYPNIKVVFLPANTTSLLQPMDQGIISIFKSHYLKITMNNIVHSDNEVEDVTSFWKNFTLKNAIENIDDAWTQVPQTAMNGVWKKVWPQCVTTTPADLNKSIDDEVNEMVQLAHHGGFSDVSTEDIQEVLQSRDEPLTNAELIENYEENTQKMRRDHQPHIQVMPDCIVDEDTCEQLTINLSANTSESLFVSSSDSVQLNPNSCETVCNSSAITLLHKTDISPTPCTSTSIDVQPASPRTQHKQDLHNKLLKAADRLKIIGAELEDDMLLKESFRSLIDAALIPFRKYSSCQ